MGISGAREGVGGVRVVGVLIAGVQVLVQVGRRARPRAAEMRGG